ncbi:MAG TPA: CDP-6-deoxy-delta-3,4-glucoseen reductase [Burkholderiales bacterium]|jgi:CDP-4-dehydro-6-deoxyglucose reductase, E3|nr:CDP-6-deoxy-delta-3,4-glucoseen reductase [Burkholderiales bacterium]
MAHRVTLKPSGHTYEVEEGKTILQAGLDAGHMLPYSCRAGVCRTCRGTVVEGKVDYGLAHETYLPQSDRDKGYALLCQAKPLSDLVVEVREVHGVRPRIIPCRVEKLDKPASDVAVLGLRLPMNENFRFLAGQYIDILLKDGKRRSYSLATKPDTGGVTALEIHVRHTPGGLFTEHVFQKLKVRDLLRFEGPLGSFYLREESEKPMILLASGTGFAPIRSIIESALEKKLEQKRPMTLYWGCRVKQDLYQMELAQSWVRPGFKFVPVLSDEKWEGRTGFVHRAVMEDFPDMSGVQVYACGAPIMVESARKDFSLQCRLPAEEFFADSFITEAEKALTP